MKKHFKFDFTLLMVSLIRLCFLDITINNDFGSSNLTDHVSYSTVE